uniref:Uncharacterized protein MANES_06G041200 n=1 Tax=Rhizophora mucronata TaxID=61149 RepID=A0A2P2K101_RHIMU
MAFQDHLTHQMAFQIHQPSSAGPAWLNNAAIARRDDDVHKSDSDNNNGGGGEEEFLDSDGGGSGAGGGENWERTKCKADILGHPLYEQLLAAHVACLRIATPVDQLARIDAQLAQSQDVVAKYSVFGNGQVANDKELDQFMVCVVSLVLCILFLFPTVFYAFILLDASVLGLPRIKDCLIFFRLFKRNKYKEMKPFDYLYFSL